MPHSAERRRGKPRFDDEEPIFARRQQRRALPTIDEAAAVLGGPPGADRWSTWDQSTAGERGPQPYPDWLVTDLAAADTELGILKTGKEADVFLLDRAVAGTGRSCLLAAKRYRSAEHRQFHRDIGYREGRVAAESRVARAIAKRTAAGRQMIADLWARAEFSALCQLYLAGIPVPYPAQILGTEVLLEFIGDPDGTAAPRLAEIRPDGAELIALWDQAVLGAVRPGEPRPGPRRPVRLQRAGAPRPPGADRPAAGGGRDRASGRGRVPGPGRRQPGPLVRRPRPGRLSRRRPAGPR